MGKTKQDGIQYVAEICQESQDHTREILSVFLDWILREVLNGETVKVHRFGTFHPKFREQQIMRNPRTQEEVNVSEMRSIRFSPSTIYGKQHEENFSKNEL